MTRVGIIVGSTRPGRIGGQVAQWVAQRAAETPGVTVDLVDLAELALPFLDEPQDATTHIYQHAHTKAWSARVAAMDAVVLITPEYNGSFSAPLKNALDFLYYEWNRKPVAVIGYGGTSSGTRAVQSLTPVVVALGMVPAGNVYLPFRRRLNDLGQLKPNQSDDSALDSALENLVELASVLAPMRRKAAA